MGRGDMFWRLELKSAEGRAIDGLIGAAWEAEGSVARGGPGDIFWKVGPAGGSELDGLIDSANGCLW